MKPQSFKYQLLSDLLATLEAEEFPIGIGKHLDLQQLISKFPEDIDPLEMKTLLCPLFAKSKQDQAYFYELFDQSLARVKAKTWQPQDESNFINEDKINRWEKWIKLIAGLLLLTIAGLIYILSTGDKPLKMSEPLRHSIGIEEGGQYQFSLTELYKNKTPAILDSTMKIQYVYFADGQHLKSNPDFGNYQIDSNGVFSVQILDSASVQNIEDTIFAKYDIGVDTTIINMMIIEEAVEDTVEVETQADTLMLREHPSPKDLSQLFVEQEPSWITWFNDNKNWFKPLVTFLLLMLMGLIHNWLNERDQQIIADIQSKDDPPLLWNIEVPNVGKLGLNEDYFKVLHQMRQRTNDDYVVLDIPKTVNKTIEQGGVVDFQYAFKTRPPEYLLLIDRQNSKNHRAHFYDFIFESFKGDEVFIERFFYEGDIRLCWNETFPNGIKLQDLQQSHRDARLIIVGNGFQLLNPRNGKLAKWTRLFDAWRDKAILSPRPTKSWGGRERQLEEKFIMLPASVQSLTLMVDKMEAVDPDEIKTKLTDEIIEPIEFQGDLIETLHHYFSVKKDGKIVDDRMVQWIAACAIYPTIHWDLTMFLGKELSDDDHNLLTLDRVLQLTRLPWFVDGKIPEQARLELLEYLPAATELQLRESLQQLFETVALPSENSVAHSDARMNIALNDYLLKKDNRFKTEYEQYLQAGTEADFTMLKYLTGEKSPKDFEVDKKWKKYAQGEKPDNFSFIRVMILGILSWLVIGFMWWYSPTFNGCEGGEIIEFKELELCIKNKRDRLNYREHQIRGLIEESNYAHSDSLIYVALKEFANNELAFDVPNTVQNTATVPSKNKPKFRANEDIQNQVNDLFINQIPELSNDTSILQFNNNISVDYYNHGVPVYNEYLRILKVENSEGFEQAVLKNEFCEAFDLARFYAGQGSYLGEYKNLEPLFVNICKRDVRFPEKVLAKEISGQVLDKETQETLENVDVTIFSQKVKTDAKGRFTLQVPSNIPNVGKRSVTIYYTKNGFKDASLTYSALNWMVRKEGGNEKVDIGEIFLKEIGNSVVGNENTTNFNLSEGCQTSLDALVKLPEQLESVLEEKLSFTIEEGYRRIGEVEDCNLNGDVLEFFKEKRDEFYTLVKRKNRLLDNRNGKVYKTTEVGKQTWMAENLDYEVLRSKCYDNNPSNCETYGRLYNTKITKDICPSGWRVPGYEDFEYLIQKYGIAEDQNFEKNYDKAKLKKAYDALMPGGISGFNWLQGGVYSEINNKVREFNNLGKSSFYMTSSTRTRLNEDRMVVYGTDVKGKTQAIIKGDFSPKNNYYASCRCVKGPIPSGSDFQQPQKASTLTIEIINVITKELQPNYTIEINGIKSSQIKTDRSGARFTSPVIQGEKYTLIAKVDGKEKERKTITIPSESQYKIIWELGIPVVLDKEPTYNKDNLPDLEMVTIPSGTFMMGSEDGNNSGKPDHQVSIQSFKMAKYEVTQRLYEAVMGENPSGFKDCERCPVENVSWGDAKIFIIRLNKITGQKYRLPMEAEWEYTARGGEEFQYAGSNDIGKVGWFDDNSEKKTHPVGGLKKNGYGLYDMSGNVWEWVEDCWDRDSNNAPVTNCPLRVLRGGSWFGNNVTCKVFFRTKNYNYKPGKNYGFRLAQD